MGTKKQNSDHAGSGIDQPDSKGLAERLDDTVKKLLPKQKPATQTGSSVEKPKRP